MKKTTTLGAACCESVKIKEQMNHSIMKIVVIMNERYKCSFATYKCTVSCM